VATVEERVLKVVGKQFAYLGHPERVVSTARFAEDLHADTLDLVVLGLDLVDEFGIDVPDGEMERFATVQDAIDFVRSQVA
jgi:acyl carrier protein